MRLGHAHARAEVDGLHEDGVRQTLLDGRHGGGATGGRIAQHEVLHLGQAAGREDVLHHLLVHADGAGGDAGPGVGQAGHLEQALDRAVFGERAVHDREGEVQRLEGPVARAASPGRAGSTTRCTRLRRRGVQPVAQRRLEIGGLYPAPVASDAHGDDVVLVAVEHRRDEARRREGDLVFGGTAAEDQGQLQHGG